MRIEVWQGKPGKRPAWHWHLRAKNGKIVTDADAFPTKANALRAAKSVVRAIIVRLYPKFSTAKTVHFESSQSGDKLIVKWS